MALSPIPVASFLVPEHSRTAPDGFTLVDEPLTRGLPHTITLASDVRLTLTLPTGLARAWRDADPGALVSAGDDERVPPAPHTAAPVGDSGRAPFRIGVQVGQDVVAVIPVVAGRRQTVPDVGDTARGARVELEVLGWSLAAGTVRGAGDYGSRIMLAWRRADLAEAQFAAPVLNPTLERRLREGGLLPALTNTAL